MAIQFEIPFEAMDRPGVASALAELILALGGVSQGAGPQIIAAPAPAANVQPLRESAQAKPAWEGEDEVTLERAPQMSKERALPQSKKAPKKAPKVAKAKPAVVKKSYEGTLTERWEAYYEDLPESSKKFIDLLKNHGKLTVDQALEGLELENPKAMGGLTGAMGRWAPQKGVTLPFEANKDSDGERYWQWNESLLHG